jgi:hypothetical protein
MAKQNSALGESYNRVIFGATSPDQSQTSVLAPAVALVPPVAAALGYAAPKDAVSSHCNG